MNETLLQQALRTWVRKSSRLDDSKIVWAQQDVVRLPVPFITMRLGDLVKLGAADEVTHDFDATRPAGEEIEITVNGRRQGAVSIQCFGGNSDSAMKIMLRVEASLSLPSVMELLEAAEVSVYDTGAIQNVTALLETAFEPRAVMDAYFYCSEAVSERTTYIESVGVTNQIETPNTTFTIPEE